MSTCVWLRPGMRFFGKQSCEGVSFSVEVEIKDYHGDDDTLSGYMNLRGIPEKESSFTTCFDGEIIGKHHKFITRKWDASFECDAANWGHFDEFQKYRELFNYDNFKFEQEMEPDVVFMRWKERFMVPDHRLTLAGVSYDGFYYICLKKSTGRIRGYYFIPHQTSGLQNLILAPLRKTQFGSYDYAP